MSYEKVWVLLIGSGGRDELGNAVLTWVWFRVACPQELDHWKTKKGKSCREVLNNINRNLLFTGKKLKHNLNASPILKGNVLVTLKMHPQKSFKP